MAKVIQSYTLLEIKLPAITLNGEKLPEVILPRAHYSGIEMQKGKRSVMKLDDLQVKRVEADENVMGMFNPSKGGVKKFVGYRWLDHIPADMRNERDVIIDLQKENAVLRAKLRKAGIDPAAADPPPKTEPDEDGELKEATG